MWLLSALLWLTRYVSPRGPTRVGPAPSKITDPLNPLRRHDDPPPDPIQDITHREIPDLTEAQHELVVKAIYRLPPTESRRELADIFETAARRPGHPRPLASLDWEKAGKRGCSEPDLFFDLAHGQGD